MKQSPPCDRFRVRPGAAPCGFLPGVLVLLLWIPFQELAGQATPPDATYRTFRTEHFRVTYAEGLEAVADRAAERAENAHALLRERFLPAPPGVIDILVTDHSDLSNGFALVTPTNRIVIWASPPVEGIGLAHYDDWLELVVLHEVVHIFHLDRTGLPGRILRRVLGRVPERWPYFAGFTLPRLVIEGLAVQLESEMTGGGRLHGTFQDAIVRGQALAGGVEGVDEAIGNSPVWPGGDRPYIYGGLFFGYLAERFGSEAVARFLDAAAEQWVPYRMDAAARKAFGVSFARLWEEWSEAFEEETRAIVARIADTGPPDLPERLTHGAREAFHPTPRPGGGAIVYLRSDGQSDTRLVLREEGGSERTLALWNGISPPTWTPDGGLLVPRLEFEDPFRLRRELYGVDPEGEFQPLTRGLRIVHASANPVTGQIVAVSEGEGMNGLLLLTPEGNLDRVLRAPRPGLLWSFPRWSPDGSRIAVARWRIGGLTGIQILNPGEEGEAGSRDRDGRVGGGESVLFEDPSLNTAPAWSPDGRWVIWSSDRSGIPNLIAAPSEGGAVRQVTSVATAATYPAVDDEGQWIYFSLLGGEGWDIARVPFDPSRWTDPLPVDSRYLTPHGRLAAAAGDDAAIPLDLADPAPGARRPSEASEPYSPLSTLRPAYWLPEIAEAQTVTGFRVLPWALGFETSGSDLVERHRYTVRARFPVQDGARTEIEAIYRWSGLGTPAVVLDGSQRYSAGAMILGDRGGEPAVRLFPRSRERSLGGGLEFRRQRFRSLGVFTLGVRGTERVTELLELDRRVSEQFRLNRPRRSLLDARIGALFSTVRSFPFSISPEEGLSVSAAYRERWDPSVPDSLSGVLGADGRMRDLVAVARAFRGFSGPGFSNHVLALRLSGGVAAGSGAGDAHFPVGGGGGGGSGSAGFTFDEAVRTFPVRGYALGSLSGVRAMGGSVEWRFPLRLLHGGLGSLPLHFDRLSGGVFLEGAAAQPRAAEWGWLGSAGVEAALIHSVFFDSPSRLRGGIAFPFAGGGSPSIYAAYGLAF